MLIFELIQISDGGTVEVECLFQRLDLITSGLTLAQPLQHTLLLGLRLVCCRHLL